MADTEEMDQMAEVVEVEVAPEAQAEPEPEPEPEPAPEPEPEPEPQVEEEVLQDEEGYEESEEKPKFKPAAPKIPDSGEKVDFDDIQKKRQNKDFAELQQLIDDHFEQRKKEEEELIALKDRIEKRRTERAEQVRIRSEQDKERQARREAERMKREDMEAQKKMEHDMKAKSALTGLGTGFSGALQRAEARGRKKQRLTEREKKRNVLSARLTVLTVDGLSESALRDKAKELWEKFHSLQSDKYDTMEKLNRQRYEVISLRNRIDELQKHSKKGAKVRRRK